MIDYGEIYTLLKIKRESNIIRRVGVKLSRGVQLFRRGIHLLNPRNPCNGGPDPYPPFGSAYVMIIETLNSSLQCYNVLSDILVKNELCKPLERGSNVLSTGEGFICLSPASKLKIAVLFCSIFKKTFSFSAIVF